MDGIIKKIYYGDAIIELPYEIEYDKKILKSDSFTQQTNVMLWYAIKNIMEEIVKMKECKIAPSTVEDHWSAIRTMLNELERKQERLYADYCDATARLKAINKIAESGQAPKQKIDGIKPLAELEASK